MLGIHFHNIKFRRERSYIKTPDWIWRKKATINPKNTKKNKYIQYAITVALNHQEIGKDPQSISKIEPFISKYNWNDINFPAGIKEWKTFERNNPNMARNILYVPTDTQEIKIAYRSKYNRKRKNQVILLMITDNEQQDNIEKYHYIALKSEENDDGYVWPTKSLSALYRGTTSSHNGDFYRLDVCVHIKQIIH